MAVSPSPPPPPLTLDPKPDNPDSQPPPPLQSTQPDPSPAASVPSPSPAPVPSSSENPNPNPNPNPPIQPTTTPLPTFQPITIAPPTIPISIPPSAPSFRPVGSIPPPQVPHYSPIPNFQNPNFQNPNLQPPGVNTMIPGSGSVSVSVSPLRPPPPVGMYQVPPPGQPPVYGQLPNGYPPGSIPPPGIPRYPTHYTPMVRTVYPPRPPGAIVMPPQLSRPPILGIRGVPPILPPVRPPVVPIIVTEKPQTTVYVGKIAPSVENDFIHDLLKLCGPVKSWKRAQDPSNGTPKGFGFCEFASAEGVLRALRLLSKFNIDGQELLLNVNQATREYLERYVEKKREREKLKEAEAEGAKKEEESAPGVEKNIPAKPLIVDSKEDQDKVDKENQDNSQSFGIVNDEDRETDRDALEKLSNMLEERLKTKPLPPPPPPSADGFAKSNSEMPSKSRDGDSDVDIMKNGDDKNDDETTSETKPSSEHDRPDTSSPDRSRRHDRRSRERDRDRDRDLKREKERELERYEKERERERVRRERERDMKIREAERVYKECVKEWEKKERDKEHRRLYEREKEKERERQRKRDVIEQEGESDDDDNRRRRRKSSMFEEKRKRRKQEKEEDLADRLKEEEEIAEANRKAIEEEEQKKQEMEDASIQLTNGNEISISVEYANIESKPNVVEQPSESYSGSDDHPGDVIMTNGIDDSTMSTVAVSETRQSSGAPSRKLGFGLVGSGKRTAVPSVFHEEDEDEAGKDKKMRPLVPIDYSTEELRAVQPPVSGATPPHLAAAAEFAKRLSNVNPKEERTDMERDRNKRSGDRSSQRERDRNDEDSHRTRDENKERSHDREHRDREHRDREHVPDKLKTPENKKLLDAKQLIDMIPKTKEELFSYEINWAVYDTHELHERMRPWISKKITEFLGEEEATLVDYIVSSTKEHVRASQMLELLQSILDDEAEMFVLKMWRMLIFEIKKVETGLGSKSRA